MTAKGWRGGGGSNAEASYTGKSLPDRRPSPSTDLRTALKPGAVSESLLLHCLCQRCPKRTLARCLRLRGLLEGRCHRTAIAILARLSRAAGFLLHRQRNALALRIDL